MYTSDRSNVEITVRWFSRPCQNHDTRPKSQ